jgi:aminoglycoside phosphotransferase (APT) family kinase protein
MEGMEARGVRIGWTDLPARLHDHVAAVLGAPVVEAVSQAGGFSPGSADRVVTAQGRRAFVKAVSPTQNDESPGIHRREIEIAATLPSEAPTPRLLGSLDDGEWVLLVFEDVDGRQPATPWLDDELDAVLAACHQLADRLTPAPPTAMDTGRLGEYLRSWESVRDDPPDDLDPWVGARIDDLCALGRRGAAAIAGNTLAHTDLRADNILLRPDGSVVFVDWPWATRGAAWLDIALLLVNVAFHGSGQDLDALAARHCSAAPDDLTAVLVGLAGYFAEHARRPAPPGLPTVRAFQAAQGRTTLAWARSRLARPG